MSTDWLKQGKYELEAMGNRYPASIHLRSPFDGDNARVKVNETLFSHTFNDDKYSSSFLKQGDYSNAPEETKAIASFLDEHRQAMGAGNTGGRFR